MQHNAECSIYQKSLPWYVAQQLAAAEHEAVRAHLATCARCQAELRRWQDIASYFAQVPPATSHPDTWDAIAASLAHSRSNHHDKKREFIMPVSNVQSPISEAHVANRSRQRAQRPIAILAPFAAVVLISLSVLVFKVLPSHATPQPGVATTPTPFQRTSVPAHGSTYSIPGNIEESQILSNGEAWAVGNTTSSVASGRPLIVHYVDGSWQSATLDVPGGFLMSISMLSSTEGWAVGEILDSTGTSSTPLLVHFDGTRWTQLHIPVLQSYSSCFLAYIQMISSKAGVAEAGCNGKFQFLIDSEGQWHITNPPVTITSAATDAGGTQPNDIMMVSPNSIWARGDSAVVHFDGSHWSTVYRVQSTDSDHIVALVAPSDTDVWVQVQQFTIPGGSSQLNETRQIEMSTGGTFHPLGTGGNLPISEFLHFDGKTWISAPLPAELLTGGNPSQTPKATLGGFIAPDWARLNWVPQSQTPFTVLHRSGDQWQLTSVPDLLFAASQMTAGEAWGLGFTGKNTLVILHYTHGVWQAG